MPNFHVRIDHYIHSEPDDRLDRILALLNTSAQKESAMALDLSHLEAEVGENSDAVASAVSLLDTLADELRAAASDPAAVNALADSLSANSDTLGAAVVRNTPAG